MPDRPQLVFVGRIRTQFKKLADCPKNARFSESPTSLEIFPDYAEGLSGIDACSHIFVLYWLHEADRQFLKKITPHDNQERGVFAIRSPARPNPIGLSPVRLLSREGRFLEVSGLDCLDGTPLLDIKPYVSENDSHPEAVVDWLSNPTNASS